MSSTLIKDLNIRVFLSGKHSLFRHYQDLFLKKYGGELRGRVVELGGEKKYGHERFLRNHDDYIVTNIARDHDLYLDITDMSFADDSQDAYLCVSVLEHVYDIPKAFQEIRRTLRPGGRILITTPFAYSLHDEADYWRPGPNAYTRLLEGFEIRAVAHLGGLFSSIADNLKRPKGKWTLRYTPYKLLGLCVLLLGRIFERKDRFPLGFGIYAEKLQRLPEQGSDRA